MFARWPFPSGSNAIWLVLPQHNIFVLSQSQHQKYQRCETTCPSAHSEPIPFLAACSLRKVLLVVPPRYSGPAFLIPHPRQPSHSTRSAGLSSMWLHANLICGMSSLHMASARITAKRSAISYSNRSECSGERSA